MVAPREHKFLGNIGLSLPKSVIGRKLFTLKYHLHEYILVSLAGIVFAIIGFASVIYGAVTEPA